MTGEEVDIAATNEARAAAEAYDEGARNERALIVRWLRARALEVAVLGGVEAAAVSVALQTAALRLEDPRPLP